MRGMTLMDNMMQFPVKPDFATVYEKYYNRIYKYAFTILLNRDDAEDVVEETFMLAYTHYDSYDPAKASVVTWLSRIAHNQAVNMVRSASYRKRADMPEYYEPADNGSDMHKEIEDREIVMRLYSKLSEEEREFLNLRYAMELKDAEIAELLGLNVKAVNKRYQRLLAKCRGLIE